MNNILTGTMRVRPRTDILVAGTGAESVLLDLNAGRYFSFDEVGTRLWAALCFSGSIDAAVHQLLAEYDVEEARLRHDVLDWVRQLVDHGLADVSGA